MKLRHPVAIALPLLWAAIAHGAPAPAEPDCFDAEVSARILRQTPTVFPDCGTDCIVARWPWFLDLDVRRVHSGPAGTGRLTVQSVQHTDYRSDLGARLWLLRRNTLGGFNLVALAEGRRPRRCSAGTPPATPFIQPGAGRTLEEIRREGEAENRGGSPRR